MNKLSLRSAAILLILFFMAYTKLSGQDAFDLVFLKNGEVLKGNISIKQSNGQYIYLFSEQSRPEPTRINPEIVKSLALFDGDTKGKRRVFISAQPTNHLGFSFFEEIDKSGKYALYKSLQSDSLYFQMENKELKFIPNNRTDRIGFYDSLSTQKPKLVNLKKFYADGFKAYRRYSRSLKYSSERYPNSYWGVSADYGWFTTKSIAKENFFDFFKDDDLEFQFDKIGASIYFNQGLNKKG